MAKTKAGDGTVESLELVELVAIKRLLVFQLLWSGASQKEVATALGVNQSSISRMFPADCRNPVVERVTNSSACRSRYTIVQTKTYYWLLRG